MKKLLDRWKFDHCCLKQYINKFWQVTIPPPEKEKTYIIPSLQTYPYSEFEILLYLLDVGKIDGYGFGHVMGMMMMMMMMKMMMVVVVVVVVVVMVMVMVMVMKTITVKAGIALTCTSNACACTKYFEKAMLLCCHSNTFRDHQFHWGMRDHAYHAFWRQWRSIKNADLGNKHL